MDAFVPVLWLGKEALVHRQQVRMFVKKPTYGAWKRRR